MEGYYWRFGDVAGRSSVAVIAGVCRTWAMLTLAAEPGGFARTEIASVARADPRRLGVEAAAAPVAGGAAAPTFSAGADGVRLRLAADAWLEATFSARHDWPLRRWGALGPGHWAPGLGQYWSPHLLGARVSGAARVGARELSLDGARVYAEKNWGASFARHWWWGQAWLDDDAGVAFAGGRLRNLGAPTAVVVWSPRGLVRLAPPFARTIAGAGGGAWRVSARSARFAVELEGASTEPALRLAVPIPAERRVEPRSDHHLRGRVAVTVRRGAGVWLRADSSLAGLEEGRPR
jgi:Tocopherol cyclase